VRAAPDAARGNVVLATPTTNFVPYSIFDPSLTGSGIYIASGYMWGTIGSGVTLTYSFPTGTASHMVPYSDLNEWRSWFSTTTAERAAIRGALSTWSRFADVNFVETPDNAMTVGELRFAYSNTLGANAAAHAYYPFDDPSSGDVWFNPDSFNDDGGGVPAGSYDFLTILHEVGHALGLKHSFEDSSFPYPVAPPIPAAKDNMFYSIMSYTASPWSADGDNFASFYPTTPMYYDLLAIERMYGQQAYHAGNNVYSFSAGHKYWQAIHDTGGNDSIVYSGSLASSINLKPGQFSKLSDPITFQRPNGSSASSRATVTIGPDVVIENARGGSGNDLLSGNDVRNILVGNGGNDTLRGYAGNDHLRGGLGNDSLSGGPDSDSFVFDTRVNSLNNRDTVRDFVPGIDRVVLNDAIFSRLTTSGPLADGYFHVGAHAADGNDYIVYYQSAGRLIYDDNGSRPGHEVIVANFIGKPVLSASDFVVV